MATLRAVVWCAVSTKQQIRDEKDSLPSQERDGVAFAESQGWRVASVMRVPGFSRDYIDIHECAEDMAAQGITAFRDLLTLWQDSGFDVLICRDGNRFARTQTLHSYVTERTISIGARIYSMLEGWVDERNYRLWTAFNGYKAAGEIDELRAKFQIGLTKRAQLGLPASRPLRIFRIVKVNGRSTVELRPDVRPLLDDLATLIVEGVAWKRLEHELHDRFGHPLYPKMSFYDLVLNPHFWGHSGKHYHQKRGVWLFDPDEPAPDGVTLYYHTHPAAYTGAQATAVIAELRRRDQLTGRSRPHNTHLFTHLLLCGSCNAHFVVRMRPNRTGDPTIYYGCRRLNEPAGTEPIRCDNHRVIRTDKIQVYVEALIRELIRVQSPDVLASTDQRYHLNRLDELQREETTLTRQIEQLIMDRVTAPTDTVRDLYTRKLDNLAHRLDAIKANITRQQALSESSQMVRSRQEAFAWLTENVGELWTFPRQTINQQLHRLFGKKRMVVQDGEIVGLADAPLSRRAARKRGDVA